MLGNGHVSLMSAVFSFMVNNNVDLTTLVAVGCDGAPANTGKLEVILACFENHPEKKKQFSVKY